MAELAVISTIASIGGTILSAAGQIQAGNAANANAKFQARQQEQQAGQARASAQRGAFEERRRAAIGIQRGQALAAASGGGATDKTIADLTGGVAAQGEYNALAALFEGGERARGLGLNAATARFEGKQAKRAGAMGAMTTIVSAAGSLATKYGTPNATKSQGANATKYQGAEFAVSGLPWQAAGNTRPAWMR